ncbi:MAG: hypothetical protein ACR2PT_15885, partial [Endozoicomonas sp.]
MSKNLNGWDTNSASTGKTVNIHFVPVPEEGLKESPVRLKFNKPVPVIDWSASAGSSACTFDNYSVSLSLKQDAPFSVLSWSSGQHSFQDFIIPIIKPQVSEIYTYTIEMPGQVATSVYSLLQEAPHDPERLSIKLTPPWFTPNEDLSNDQQSILKAYLALIEMLLDIYFGDYLALLSPEQYQTRKYLLGEKSTGPTTSIAAFDSHPAHPFSANGPSEVHYRNWRMVLQVGGECNEGYCSGSESQN